VDIDQKRDIDIKEKERINEQIQKVNSFAVKLEQEIEHTKNKLDAGGLLSMKELFPHLDPDNVIQISDMYKRAASEQDQDKSFNEARLYSLKQFKELSFSFFSQSQA